MPSRPIGSMLENLGRVVARLVNILVAEHEQAARFRIAE